MVKNICIGVVFVFLSYWLGNIMVDMQRADSKYCMEQTTYEYNNCMVKIQG